MKKILYIIWLAFTLSVGLSCSKDGLYLEDPNNMAATNFWKNERDAVLGLAGVFDAYQNNALMGRKYREFDHATDNAFRGNATGGWNEIDSDTHTASSAQVVSFWNNFYNVGARANEVIFYVPKIPASAISDASKNRIVAEATFLRAYAYHDLTALWGSVPVYLDPIKAFDEAKAPSTRQEVISYFTNELETMIIPNLPETVIEKGRIMRAAAIALLGKFYLLEENYPKAAEAFLTIINTNQYRLYSDYAKLFTPEGEFSSENLFEINFVGGAFDQGEIFSSRVDTTLAAITPAVYWIPVRNLADSYLYTDGRPYSNAAAVTNVYGPRSPLFNSANPYVNRDPRLRATLYTHLDVKSNGGYIINVNVNNPNAILNSLGVKKYSTIGAQQYENGGPQNYYVIRYAEVLLGYAEAKNEELIAPDQSVRDAINTVRQRVGMPTVDVTVNKVQMRQYIRDERRWEFALEHQRFFDLKRWKDVNGEPLALTLPPSANNNKKASKPRIYTWPYPQTEMDTNPKLKAHGQNAGY